MASPSREAQASAMLLLPFPGGPYRKIDWRAPRAGPNRLRTLGGSTRWSRAALSIWWVTGLRLRRRPRVLVDLDQLLGPLPARPADYVLQPVGELGSADRAPDPRGGDIALVGEELERVTHDIPGQADMGGGVPHPP